MIRVKDIKPEMIANNGVPFILTHPGELIKDELASRNLSQSRLARDLGVSASFLNEVIKGKRAVNTELALLLEAALGVPAEVWLKLQSDYNMQKAKSNKTFMARLESIRKIASML